jgi:hypothetical protein
METTLLENLLLAVAQGKRADGGFKKEAWENVLRALRRQYPNTTFEQCQVKTKTDHVRWKYRAIQRCFKASGFGHDPVKNIPVAPPDVWAAFIAVRIHYLFQNLFLTLLSDPSRCGRVSAKAVSQL